MNATDIVGSGSARPGSPSEPPANPEGQGPIIEAMAVRVSSPVLIGRSDEAARLNAALDRARHGHSSATVIAGEAGVGKTRLVADFALDAQADGVVVLIGGCIDLGEGGLPYAPVVEALRGLARRADPEELESLLGPGRSELARLVPDELSAAIVKPHPYLLLIHKRRAQSFGPGLILRHARHDCFGGRLRGVEPQHKEDRDRFSVHMGYYAQRGACERKNLTGVGQAVSPACPNFSRQPL